jgi:hypothetical protein
MPDTDLPLSTPLPFQDTTLSLAPLDLVTEEGEDATGPDNGVFRWPMPPFAAYPPAAPQTESEPCEIEGLNGRVMRGRLSFFVPQEGVAHVQVPPARTTMPLRFSQFRSLRLTRAVSPLTHKAGADAAQDALNDCLVSPYRVTIQDGAVLEGVTVGHHRAERQLAGAADQHMILEASRRACPTSTSNASPGARRCKHPLPQGRRAQALPGAAAHLPQRLVARIKIMCDLDISERRKPQDGKINFAVRAAAEARTARGHHPHQHGLEDVVMRLLARPSRCRWTSWAEPDNLER